MKQLPHAKSEPAQQTTNTPEGRTFLAELREILVPEKKWHYVFYLVVVLVALAYWVGSLVKQPEASWAEIVMYRPGGDNQVFPIIAALSQFNFGDPTDAVVYGQGLGGFQAVILLPYALGYRLFGGPGYMIVDVLLTLCFFVAAALFLRRCRLGNLTSLILASALATDSLQVLSQKISQTVAKLLAMGGFYSGDWDFPPLFNLAMFEKRIPRPMVTEIFLLLTLYFLLRLWQERRMPSFKWGLAVGASLAIVTQGDPYSCAALGLLLVGVLAVCMASNAWKFPWRCALGGAIGALACGWFFIIQLLNQDPESAIRFGAIDFGRSKIWFLPGYAGLLRVLVVCLLAWALISASRRLRKPDHAHPHHPKHDSPDSRLNTTAVARIGLFCCLMVIAAFLAKPVQILLLGKSIQTYHYLLYTLPVFYGYAVIILLAHLVQAAFPRAWEHLASEFRQPLHWSTAMLLGLGLFVQTALGVEESLETLMSPGISRKESSPYQVFGTQYRAGFRALDQEFRNNPTLRDSRTFATFCHEVNFLLAGFHDKRAYLPDNAYSTLSDHELEKRLCEVGKICGMSPDIFLGFIQNEIVMNFWLGCAKYWFTPEHTYAALNEYPPEEVDKFKDMPEGKPFNLFLPFSAARRLSLMYDDIEKPNPGPDVIVVTLLVKNQGVYPRAPYKEVYSNEIFSVYVSPSAEKPVK